jgi:hypothetical protein
MSGDLVDRGRSTSDPPGNPPHPASRPRWGAPYRRANKPATETSWLTVASRVRARPSIPSESPIAARALITRKGQPSRWHHSHPSHHESSGRSLK